MALKLAEPPENVDKTLWLYELCRFLIQKVNSIIVALFADSPPCSSITCPEMRASEWQYLCAVHDPPKSCCAIDYCCHTLDWAANTLTSPKHFPSRLALGTDQSTQHSQARQLTNIFRRVYRIFAHAWFQHRDMFWNVEARTGLYIFFKTVCDYYGLIPEDNYTIPSEAEGIEPPPESRSMPPLILKREPSEPGPEDMDNATVIESNSDHTLSAAGTTKRHRHSPSVGPTAVSTVVEEAEEEDEDPETSKQPFSQLSEPSREEGDAAQSGEPTDESKAETEDDAADDSAPVVPKGDAADEVEQEKQSASEETKGDPTPQDDEKHNEDDEISPNDADDAETSDVGASTSKISDAEESEEESTESEDDDVADSTTSADARTAAKGDEPLAEAAKSEN
jgi:hypothetical protein